MRKNRSLGKKIFWFLDRQSQICYGPSLFRLEHLLDTVAWTAILSLVADGGRVQSVCEGFDRGHFSTLPWSHFPSHVMILHVILCCPFPSLNWNDLKDISIESEFEFSVSNLKSTIWFPTSLLSTGNESRTLIYGFHCFAVAFLLILEKLNFEKYR